MVCLSEHGPCIIRGLRGSCLPVAIGWCRSPQTHQRGRVGMRHHRRQHVWET